LANCVHRACRACLASLFVFLALPASRADVTLSVLPAVEKRWALVVGVDRYDDSQIVPLRGAANDATAMAEAIVRYSGFPSEQVVLLSPEQSRDRQPTRANILFQISNLSQLVPKDGLFLFFFAGHGVERDGSAFLLPADARMTENIKILEATGIGVLNLRTWIQDMGVKQVLLFLDACRNNPAAGRGAESDNNLTETFTQGFRFDKRNQGIEAFAALYATAVGQRAYEYSERRHGYFTWAVIEALKGGAANASGEVTLAALEKYVQEVVPRRVQIDLGAEKAQKPFAEVSGYRAGELVLANVARADFSDPAGVRYPEALSEWERIQDRRDPKALAQFLDKYPDGPFAAQALSRLEEIEWERIQTSKDLALLRAFYERRPAGPFAHQARTAIQNLEQTERGQQALLAALRRYEKAYQSRSTAELAAAWPNLPSRDLERIEDFFRISQSIELNLYAEGDAEFSAEKARLHCRRLLAFTDQRGNQKTNSDRVTVAFRKLGDAWVIDSLQ
jgi:uncharacterized caspase-like protein